MINFTEVFHDQTDTIVEKWVEAVREDNQIETSQELTYKAVLDSLPFVLDSIANILTRTDKDDLRQLVNASLEHGIIRAAQGYDAEEIAREYRLLREVIFAVLEPSLLNSPTAEAMRVIRLIDTAIDEVIAQCFKSYTKERLREIEQLQRETRLTNQELTRLVRASQENLSQLAHELKTPLTSIIGYSDLFLRQQRNNQKNQDSVSNLEHIEKVIYSSRQLLHLINNTLEISRSESGKLRLQATEINVEQLVDQVIDMVQPLAAHKKLSLRVDLKNAPKTVFTDSLRLQQIITNLLTNAIRYTQQGSVQLTCQVLSEKEWSISVTDTGVGISQDDQKRIFEPYFRVMQSDQSYSPNSTGLGLAIVSKLVKLLQGKVELASQKSAGSTFTIILPLAVSVEPA
jgi:signal transduction histidine kinase